MSNYAKILIVVIIRINERRRFMSEIELNQSCKELIKDIVKTSVELSEEIAEIETILKNK